METSYNQASRVLRSGIEALEDAEPERDLYTQDIEAFVENIFEPVLYDELDNSERFPDFDGDIETERVDEEFDYWLERFGDEKQGLKRPDGYLRNFMEEMENIYDPDEIDTVIAPAVGGVPHGILAKEILDAEKFGIAAYSDKVRDEPRPTAFCTVAESEGDILIPDDNISTGSSVAGIIENIDTSNSDRLYALEEEGKNYEVVRHPNIWRLRNSLESSESKPDYLIKSGRGEVDVKDRGLPDKEKMTKKGGIYAGSAGMAALGAEGLINGRPDTLLWLYSLGMGLWGAGSEYSIDFLSEEFF